MSAITEEGRWLRIDSPLGPDALILTHLEGTEGLSRLYRFRLSVLSRRNDLAPEEILGKTITARVHRNDDDHRLFNGMAASLSADRMKTRGYRIYHIEIAPWLWFLTLRTDCRIFENKTAIDVIRAVFAEAGFSDYDASGVKGAHAVRDYCVQYRESDFDFVSRLMEQEGIFYYFRHEQGRHVLVLADNASAYSAIAEGTVLHSDGFDTFNVVSDLQKDSRFRSGRVARRDYDPLSAQMVAAQSTILAGAPDFKKYELYDYPGGAEKKAELDAFARVRMEDEETGYQTAGGEGTCVSFQPGGKIKFERQPTGEGKGKGWVLTEVHHQATDETQIVGGTPPSYRNRFTCIPVERTFRPAQATPRALVHGLQTAVVTGPEGEDIHCDAHGRIRVRFHWDRKPAQSCWVRVGQAWAGKAWGAQFLPRVGMEVLVDFLEGDPDRPLVVGTVYNGKNTPPYPLPAQAARSGIRTRSTKGGSESTFNELRFDDKNGEEEVFLQAERDFTRKVKHDESALIKRDRRVTLEEGDDSLNVPKGRITIEAGRSIELKVGQNSIKIDESGVTINGVAVILEGQTVVEAKGPSVQVTSDGMIAVRGLAVSLEGRTLVQAKGPMVQVEGQGLVTVNGGIVKVN